MDFDFSNDQEQLRDAVRKWVDKGYTFERHNSIVREGGFSRAAWTELAELVACTSRKATAVWAAARPEACWPWKSSATAS